MGIAMGIFVSMAVAMAAEKAMHIALLVGPQVKLLVLRVKCIDVDMGQGLPGTTSFESVRYLSLRINMVYQFLTRGHKIC